MGRRARAVPGPRPAGVPQRRDVRAALAGGARRCRRAPRVGGRARPQRAVVLRREPRAARSRACAARPGGRRSRRSRGADRSTTQAVHVVVAGLDLRPQDEVVTTDLEHFGLVGPLAASGARIRVARLRELPAAESFDAISAHVTPRTRLIALSHVSWLDGRVLPWQELRAQTGVPVLVDGAQSVGAIAVDASGADFYTVSAPEVALRAGRDGRRSRSAIRRRFRCGSVEIPVPGGVLDRGRRPSSRSRGRRASIRGSRRRRRSPALEAALAAPPFVAHAAGARGSPPGTATRSSRRATMWSPRPRRRRFSRGARASDTEADVARVHEHGVVIRELPGTGLLRASCRVVERRDRSRAAPRGAGHRRVIDRSGRSVEMRRQAGAYAAASAASAARARARSAAAPRRRSRCARRARARAARRPRRPRRGGRPPRTTAASASSCTDFGSSPSSPVGRTSPHAWTKPESSSHAKSVFLSGVSRGIARCSACERTASTTSSG